MSSRVRPAVAAIITIATLVVAACGPGVEQSPTPSPASSTGPSAGGSASPAGGVFPVLVSGELAVGPNRVLFSFVDGAGAPIGSPDRTVAVHFTGPADQGVDAPDGTFIWAIEDVAGIYVTHATFPAAGAWTAEFTTQASGSPAQTIPFSFDVQADASAVRPGEAAPSVDTPTLADVGGNAAKISTDAKPVDAFYETSVADALAAHEPFVLVFATPKFCQTATCGPTLEKVKTVAAAHPEMTFINVEPYQLELVDGQLQPVLSAQNQLQSVPATTAYGLLTEPYVFVVGGDGTVKASFELIFTPEEIDAALAGLS
jgi:hypothetical protein